MQNEVLAVARYLPKGEHEIREDDFLMLFSEKDYRKVARDLVKTTFFTHHGEKISLTDDSSAAPASWSSLRPVFERITDTFRTALRDDFSGLSTKEKLDILRELTAKAEAGCADNIALDSAKAFLNDVNDSNEIADLLDDMITALRLSSIEESYSSKWKPLACLCENILNDVPGIPSIDRVAAYKTLSEFSYIGNENMTAICFAHKAFKEARESELNVFVDAKMMGFLMDTLDNVFVAEEKQEA